jgi:hypothetical protein
MYLAAAALLVSCSEVEVGPTSEAVPVELNGVLNEGASTRAKIESTDGDLPKTDLTLSIFRADQTYGTDYADKFSGEFKKTGEISMSPAQYYLLDGSQSKFIAVYPQVAGDYTSKALEYTINGTNDVIASQLVAGDKTTKVDPLLFKHLLTQVQVRVIADQTKTEVEREQISLQWGKISTITITGKAGTATVTLPAPTADKGTEVNPLTDITFSGASPLTVFPEHGQDGGLTIPTGTDSNLYGYALFLPFNVEEELELNVTVAGKNYPVKTKLAALEANKAYAITLKFELNGSLVIDGDGGNNGAKLAKWGTPIGGPTVDVVDKD